MGLDPRLSKQRTSPKRIFSGDFHMPFKKFAFFQPFLRFFLAFLCFLGYSAFRPGSFRRKTRG
ncbi:MAG: hypothetical protein DMG43_08460 [Acidobacteria bacterium]|nr:MAG: hypothetical protein DMG43_08460 [Acidobacteriota bacterium]